MPELVLLCAVEICTLHFYYGWDPEKIVANAIFADGAAAMVIGPAESASAPRGRLRGRLADRGVGFVHLP